MRATTHLLAISALIAFLGSVAGGAEPEKITRGAGGPELAAVISARPVWSEPGINLLGTPSHDGRYLSFVDASTGDLAVRDLAAGKNIRLTHKDPAAQKEFAYFSSISPDSRQVAYAWFNDEGFYDLRLAALERDSVPRVLYRNSEAGFVQPCAWSPDGKQILTLFFRKDNISQIALVSAANGSVRTLKSLNWVYPKKMDFSPDGKFIVYDSTVKEGSEARDIFLLATDGSREVRLVEHPANDIFPVWTPDGKAVLFASDRSGTMDAWIVGVEQGGAAGQPRLVKPNLGRFLPMGITREGSYYYGLRSGSRDVYLAPVDWENGGPAEKPALASRKLRGANTSPVWSRDGRYLAFLSRLGTENFGQETRAITIRSTATGEERILTPKLAYLEKIEWSPDGRSLLAAGSDGKTRGGLFTLDTESGDERPLLRDHAASFRGFDGVWSADGNAVFYIRDEGEGSAIHRLDVESREERIAYRPDPGRKLHALAISPAGTELAFAAVNAGDQAETVYVFSIGDGGTRELLKLQRGGVAEIEWMPDGRALLLAGARSLWRVPIAGTETPQQLAVEISGDAGFSMHPDGRQLAFIAGETQAEIWVIEDFLPGLHAAR